MSVVDELQTKCLRHSDSKHCWHQKLTPGEMHVLELIRKEAKAEGWAPVSQILTKLFVSDKPRFSSIPKQLCEFEFVGDDGRGRARLTMAGNALLDSMAWL